MTTSPTTTPWIVEAAGGKPIDKLPKGVYSAAFVSAEPFSNAKIQDKIKWTWKVESGPFKGKFATALTDKACKATTLAGRLLSGMAGRELAVGEDILAVIESCKSLTNGIVYTIVIEGGPMGGGEQVRSAFRPPM